MAIQKLAGPNSDADLIAWERELTELLLEHAHLEAAWPKGATAVERAAIGHRLITSGISPRPRHAATELSRPRARSQSVM